MCNYYCTHSKFAVKEYKEAAYILDITDILLHKVSRGHVPYMFRYRYNLRHYSQSKEYIPDQLVLLSG